jgi:nucleotide-binding universal stress UspA family protein
MAVLEHAIAQAVEGMDPQPEVERVIRDGSPSHALIEESANADMVVVGARGHGGFIGLLLGSVASQCISHARRPTVVVPR